MTVTDLINFDPSTITVTRHTRTQHSGGWDYTTAPIAPQVVRIYNYSTRNANETVILEGEVKTITHGILGVIGADFVCNHLAYDTFTWNAREYRVVGVRRYTDVNVPTQTQCDCVAV